ncbi:TolC family protein [Devosia sp. A8/3-2]|nr:TolC family protein [Devosia sp. A8/3-2]
MLALSLAAWSVGGAQAQSITQALIAAYNYAPDLASAHLAAKSSAENVALARAGKLPVIGASVGSTYDWSIAGGDFTDSTLSTAGLSYNQTIFDNFKTEAQIEAARAGAEAAEYQIRNTEQNVLLAVVQAYMDVLSNRQLVALRRENVNFYRGAAAVGQGSAGCGRGHAH